MKAAMKINFDIFRNWTVHWGAADARIYIEINYLISSVREIKALSGVDKWNLSVSFKPEEVRGEKGEGNNSDNLFPESDKIKKNH